MSGLVRSSWTVTRSLDGQQQHSSEAFVYEHARLPNVTFKTTLEDSLGVRWEVELVARFDPPLVPGTDCVCSQQPALCELEPGERRDWRCPRHGKCAAEWVDQ